jgi:hypothetical protein
MMNDEIKKNINEKINKNSMLNEEFFFLKGRR